MIGIPNHPANIITATTLGLIWGLLIATMAIMLSNGGNGWNAAILYGMVAVVMSPLACIFWVKRQSISLNTVIIALIVAATANIGLFQAALNENLSTYYHLINHIVIWILLWLSWQFLLLLTFFEKKNNVTQH